MAKKKNVNPLSVDDFAEDINNEVLGKKKNRALPFIIIFFILALIVILIVLNAFGIRDNYVYPALRNVPVVKNIIPPAEDGEANLSKEELETKLKTLEAENEKYKNEIVELEVRVSEYRQEIDTLKVFENEQLQFKADKEAFDAQVASQDPASFVEFYEKVYPENADKIYREAIVTTKNDSEVKKYVKTFSAMDAGSAADILQEMFGSDMDIVVEVMKKLNTDTAAAILQEMDVENAAILARRMYPDSPMVLGETGEGVTGTNIPPVTEEPPNAEDTTTAN